MRIELCSKLIMRSVRSTSTYLLRMAVLFLALKIQVQKRTPSKRNAKDEREIGVSPSRRFSRMPLLGRYFCQVRMFRTQLAVRPSQTKGARRITLLVLMK